jgi:hypothetical protein
MVSAIILPGITASAMIRGITKMCQEFFTAAQKSTTDSVSGRMRNALRWTGLLKEKGVAVRRVLVIKLAQKPMT